MSRRDTPLDAARLLQALDRHGVDCVVIGGLAVQAHGHVRTTQDVDIVPAPDPPNLERLARALEDLDARSAIDPPASPPPDVRRLVAEPTLVLDTAAGGIDVHRDPPGAAPYPHLRSRAMILEVAGVRVAIAGRDDVIAMKRAAGRPIDRGDVIALTHPGT